MLQRERFSPVRGHANSCKRPLPQSGSSIIQSPALQVATDAERYVFPTRYALLTFISVKGPNNTMDMSLSDESGQKFLAADLISAAAVIQTTRHEDN